MYKAGPVARDVYLDEPGHLTCIEDDDSCWVQGRWNDKLVPNIHKVLIACYRSVSCGSGSHMTSRRMLSITERLVPRE